MGLNSRQERIPKQLQHCHAKQRIVFALNTKSRAKAVKYAQVICQRLDERWLPMRLDAIGLDNVLANDVTSSEHLMRFNCRLAKRCNAGRLAGRSGCDDPGCRQR